jgi:hypothetical protein
VLVDEIERDIHFSERKSSTLRCKRLRGATPVVDAHQARKLYAITPTIFTDFLLSDVAVKRALRPGLLVALHWQFLLHDDTWDLHA